jgi:hypothetical protein
VIVSGDLNTVAHTPELQAMHKAGFTSCSGEREIPTWDTRNPNVRLQLDAGPECAGIRISSLTRLERIAATSLRTLRQHTRGVRLVRLNGSMRPS